MRHRAGLKLQDVGAQVAVRAQDRVRIVKMDAVKPEPPSEPAKVDAERKP
jgi:NADH-quinone oxidoreductase subunit J